MSRAPEVAEVDQVERAEPEARRDHRERDRREENDECGRRQMVAQLHGHGVCIGAPVPRLKRLLHPAEGSEQQPGEDEEGGGADGDDGGPRPDGEPGEPVTADEPKRQAGSQQHPPWAERVRAVGVRRSCECEALLPSGRRTKQIGLDLSHLRLEHEPCARLIAADDSANVMRHVGVGSAHIIGCSMGGFATVHFGLNYPRMSKSLTAVGTSRSVMTPPTASAPIR